VKKYAHILGGTLGKHASFMSFENVTAAIIDNRNLEEMIFFYDNKW